MIFSSLFRVKNVTYASKLDDPIRRSDQRHCSLVTCADTCCGRHRIGHSVAGREGCAADASCGRVPPRHCERPKGSSVATASGGFRLVPCCCPLRAVVAGACRAAGQLPWQSPPCEIVWLSKRMVWLAGDQHSSLSMRLVVV
jgi:hypothetical protein